MMALKVVLLLWLGRHHPVMHPRIITGITRTTTRETRTVVTADVARACVMALRFTTPLRYRIGEGKSMSQINTYARQDKFRLFDGFGLAGSVAMIPCTGAALLRPKRPGTSTIVVVADRMLEGTA
jgi:hypothetical protein